MIVNARTTTSSKTEFDALVRVLMASGADDRIGGNLAPVIGLPHAMAIKVQDLLISENAKGREIRSCFVVYDEADTPRPVALYMARLKRSGQDKRSQYFRMTLEGVLEKAILSQGKTDETGKAVRGSGVKFDQDVNAPDVQKSFNAEKTFWLKEWLPKARRAAAKSSSPAAPK